MKGWKKYASNEIQTSNAVQVTIMAYEKCLLNLKTAREQFGEFRFSDSEPHLIKTEQILIKLRTQLNYDETLPAETKELISNLEWCYDAMVYHLRIVKMTKNSEGLDLVIGMLQDLLDGYRGALKKNDPQP